MTKVALGRWEEGESVYMLRKVNNCIDESERVIVIEMKVAQIFYKWVGLHMRRGSNDIMRYRLGVYF
jgi:hypothetical protein